jgi:hypothetical protein
VLRAAAFGSPGSGEPDGTSAMAPHMFGGEFGHRLRRGKFNVMTNCSAVSAASNGWDLPHVLGEFDCELGLIAGRHFQIGVPVNDLMPQSQNACLH